MDRPSAKRSIRSFTITKKRRLIMKKLWLILIIALVSTSGAFAQQKTMSIEEMQDFTLGGFQYYLFVDSHKNDPVPAERKMQKEEELNRHAANNFYAALNRPTRTGPYFSREVVQPNTNLDVYFMAGSTVGHTHTENVTTVITPQTLFTSIGRTDYSGGEVTVSNNVYVQAH